jgi:hypothetical protein
MLGLFFCSVECIAGFYSLPTGHFSTAHDLGIELVAIAAGGAYQEVMLRNVLSSRNLLERAP